MSNEDQPAPARDGTLPGEDKAPPAGNDAIEDNPDSPRPAGVEMCILKGEVPEPASNRA